MNKTKTTCKICQFEKGHSQACPLYKAEPYVSHPEWNWENKLFKEYPHVFKCNPNGETIWLSESDGLELLDSIRSLLASEREKAREQGMLDSLKRDKIVLDKIREEERSRILKKIEEMKENNIFTQCARCRLPMAYHNVCTCMPYRAALTDLALFINDLEK